MKKLSIYILFFILCNNLKAQNLVPNGQFERVDTSICPPPLIVGVSSDLPPWFTFASPDYFNVCDTSKYVGVPENFIGYQNAHSGRGYVGLLAYASLNGREYIQVPLSSSLINGQYYYIQFYLNLGGISRYAIKNFGMLFTETIYDPTYYLNNNISIYPQVKDTVMETDSINWIEVNGEYIATGGEQYITLGNFYTDAETIKQYLGGTGPLNLEAYYYIDDVYVGVTPPPVSVGEIKDERGIKLYPNPSTGNIKLEYTLKKNESGAINIYDLTGRLIKMYVLQSDAKVQNIDAVFLQSGTYVYEIVVNKKAVKTDKFTVIK